MAELCFAGKIALVNLDNKKVDFHATHEMEEDFIGGRGLTQTLLLHFEKKINSPLDPNSILAFGCGRLVGTDAPGAVRLNIDGRNIFTGGIGSANLGGGVARSLKGAGFDHILVTGQSSHPIYLWIHNGKIEFRDASHLWGKTLFQTRQILLQDLKHKRFHFLFIGPAGERRVWISAVLDDCARAAARCGLGAIMGAKKLKAIAVAEDGFVPIVPLKSELFSRITKRLTHKLMHLNSVKRKKKFGTVAAIPVLNQCGAMPIGHFEDDYLIPDELKEFSPDRFYQLTKKTILSCRPCPIKCQHSYDASFYKIPESNKLEANTVWNFGPRLGLLKAEEVLACHAVCSQYGLDIDGTAAVISFAMSCLEKGLLTRSSTDKYRLQRGDFKAITAIIKDIAYRQGLGELLSEGSFRAAKTIDQNAETLAFHIKGQDLIEPIRSSKGWALGIAVSPRGGTHTRGAPQTEFQKVSEDLGQKIWGVSTAGIPEEYCEKAKLVAYYERFHAVLDSLGLCHFVSNWSSPDLLSPKEVAQLCHLAIGGFSSAEELMKSGERIMTMEKIYNLLNTDFGKNDDFPPDYFFEKPIQSGPYKGHKLDKQKWDQLLNEYYDEHGWDSATGHILKQTLQTLNLSEFIPLLENKGKLINSKTLNV